MKTIFNYRFSNQKKGEVKHLLISNIQGKQDEQHKIKPLS